MRLDFAARVGLRGPIIVGLCRWTESFRRIASVGTYQVAPSIIDHVSGPSGVSLHRVFYCTCLTCLLMNIA